MWLMLSTDPATLTRAGLVVQGLHEALIHLPLRVILDHADLLADDALLLFHTFIGEIGDGHKG